MRSRGRGAVRALLARSWLVCALGLLVLLPSCASVDGYPKRLEYSDQFVDEVGWYASPSAVLQYNATVDVSAQTALRNQIVTARIYAINANYYKFVRDLTGQQNTGNVATDWAAIGLATAGTLAASAQTKAALAALTGGIIGAKSAIDRDVFYNKTIQTIITQMEGQRKIVLSNIYAGLKKSSTDYTLFQALADLDNYYSAGTLNGALVGLTASAGSTSDDGDVQIAAVLTGDFSYDDPAQKLRKFWKPDGKINAENQTKILTWMRKNKLQIDDITSLIYNSSFAAARAQAVKDLNIQ